MLATGEETEYRALVFPGACTELSKIYVKWTSACLLPLMTQAPVPEKYIECVTTNQKIQ